MTNEQYLKELIKKLSVPIPFQWRVQSFSKFKPQATCVPYIDARDCISLLNEHATYGWERRYYSCDGSLFCDVGVVMPDNTTQWRSDCGTESQTEKEKGQSSDAFKRACVNFGIGKFLYDMGMEYVPANAKKGDNDGDGIKKFPDVVDESGNKVWDLSEYINNRKKPTKSGKSPKPTEKKVPAQEAVKKDELTPNHKSWDYTKTRIAQGVPISEIKKHFTISEENEKLLK